MTTLYTFFPFYLLGNLHCFGMCGPLAFMLGKHRYRFLYLLGRIAAFSLAGAAAGAFGTVLQYANFGVVTSFFVALFFIFFGVFSLFKFSPPGLHALAHLLEPLNKRLVSLALQENKSSVFLFGFMTIALPCGQSLAIFSACALEGYALGGLLNGFAFSILTTPALFIAMRSGKWLSRIKKHSHFLIGGAAIFVGGLTLCRGFADAEWISHLTFSFPLFSNSHIVIY